VPSPFVHKERRFFFWFVVPRRSTELRGAQRQRVTALKIRSICGQIGAILVVDDDAADRRMLSSDIAAEGTSRGVAWKAKALASVEQVDDPLSSRHLHAGLTGYRSREDS